MDLSEILGQVKSANKDSKEEAKNPEKQNKIDTETEFSNDFESIDSDVVDLETSKFGQSMAKKQEGNNQSLETSKKLINLKKYETQEQKNRSKSVRFSQGICRRILNSKSCLVSRKYNNARKMSSNHLRKTSKTILCKSGKPKPNPKKKAAKLDTSHKRQAKPKPHCEQMRQPRVNFFENELQMAMNDIEDVEKRLHKIEKEDVTSVQPKQQPGERRRSSNEVFPNTVREKSRQKIRQILAKNKEESVQKKGRSKSNERLATVRDSQEAKPTERETDTLGQIKSNVFTSNQGTGNAKTSLNKAAYLNPTDKKQLNGMAQLEQSRAIRESFKLSMLDSQMIRNSREVRFSVKSLKPKIRGSEIQRENEGIVSQMRDSGMPKIPHEKMPGFVDLHLEKSRLAEDALSGNGKEFKSLRSLETFGSIYHSLNSGNMIKESMRGLSKNYMNSGLISKNMGKQDKSGQQPNYNFKVKRPNTPRYTQSPDLPEEPRMMNPEKRVALPEEIQSTAASKNFSYNSKSGKFENSVFGSQRNQKNTGSINFSRQRRKMKKSISRSQDKKARITSQSNREKGLFRNFKKYMKYSSQKQQGGSVKIDFNR